MDPQALKTEARSAIAGASTLGELDDARVLYLGRKSELKQALCGVRDAETGSVLNALRQELEEAVAERQAELERAELDRKLTEDVVDVTLPGDARPRGHQLADLFALGFMREGNADGLELHAQPPACPYHVRAFRGN